MKNGEKRWSKQHREYRDSPPEIDAFLKEIIEVCRKHKLSISHEDQGGSFKIEWLDEDNIEWLEAANDSRKDPDDSDDDDAEGSD